MATRKKAATEEMPMGVALPGNNYLFQVNKNVRKRCETGSKLKKSPERRQ